jgi:hypothetical protein
MRISRIWTGLRPMVFALGFVAATAGGAQAASTSSGGSTTDATPLVAYDTVGSSIGTMGVTGNPLVSFIPVTGSFQSPSNLSFGKFQVTAPASGLSTTYSNTPFTLLLKADSVNGNSQVVPNETPVQVTGHLNGTVSSPYSTDLVATFDPMANSSFTTGLYKHTLGLPDGPLKLVPSTVGDGLTTAQAHLNSQTVVTVPSPEPSTIALFTVSIIGLGFRRRMLRDRAAA